jgi:3-deoxy-D-manno-octulosonate 8-phosphate phosphatase (KDO 8-P phosphatase)
MEGKQQIVPFERPPEGLEVRDIGFVTAYDNSVLNPNDLEHSLELVHVFDKMKAVKCFIFDVDGVFTNNEVLVTEQGELLRTMNIRDGQALRYVVEAGYLVCIITGGRSEGIKKRFSDLGITEYFSGVRDKLTVLQSILQRHNLLASELCYMGDDLPDLPVLRKVMLAACPFDAVPEVLEICDYVSPHKGGMGCVRDLTEKVLKLQDKWPEI